MNEVTRKGRSGLVPATVGVLVGAVVVGGPLGYYVAQLRAQLATETASVAQLRAANAELQSTKSQLQASAAQLQATAAQLQSESEATSAQLQEQKAQAAALARPDLPVQISFRRGVVATGLVLTIKNPSASEVVVNAQFEGHGARSPLMRLVIPSNGVKEIGELEGWAFSPGDAIRLNNPDYRDIIQTVPKL